MKLWANQMQEGFGDLQQKIEAFTIGQDKHWDLCLAKYDVQGSLAHAAMLHAIGLLTDDEHILLQEGLANIQAQIEAGDFVIEEGIEDVHSQIELLLTREKGAVGKKIHSGRSRNDQALLDIKLFIRAECKVLAVDMAKLMERLLELSEKHKQDLLPGYTHLQLAMPSSFGLWFGAYAESLADDLELVQAACHVANKNPLGSAAGYGSSFPLNRQMTTELLGFSQMNYNVVYAQMTRGKTEKTMAMAMAGVAATLARMAMDLCLYMNQNFGFVSFPQELTTGSSIMPHKKNPDVFELIRAKCNRIQALPNELTLLMNNLPSGYHRDLQLTKECLFPMIGELKSCLYLAHAMLEHIQVKKDILSDEKYKYIFTVDTVNKLVMNGVPFRDAYHRVAASVQDQTFVPDAVMQQTHEGSYGNLCSAQIRASFYKSLERILN